MVAVKTISGFNSSELGSFNAEFAAEAKKFAQPDELHQRLLRIHSSFVYIDRLFVVYDYVANGSLAELLTARNSRESRGFPEEVVKILARELVHTTELLHKN